MPSIRPGVLLNIKWNRGEAEKDIICMTYADNENCILYINNKLVAILKLKDNLLYTKNFGQGLDISILETLKLKPSSQNSDVDPAHIFHCSLTAWTETWRKPATCNRCYCQTRFQIFLQKSQYFLRVF